MASHMYNISIWFRVHVDTTDVGIFTCNTYPTCVMHMLFTMFEFYIHLYIYICTCVYNHTYVLACAMYVVVNYKSSE